MFEQIKEWIGKAIAFLIVGALLWYMAEPLRDASPELQKGVVVGLVIAYFIYRASEH